MRVAPLIDIPAKNIVFFLVGHANPEIPRGNDHSEPLVGGHSGLSCLKTPKVQNWRDFAARDSRLGMGWLPEGGLCHMALAREGVGTPMGR